VKRVGTKNNGEEEAKGIEEKRLSEVGWGEKERSRCYCEESGRRKEDDRMRSF